MNDEVGVQRSGVGLPAKRESTSRNADEADDTSFVLVYQWIVTWQARLIVQEDRLELAIPLPRRSCGVIGRDGKNTLLCSSATWSMSEPVSDLTPLIEFLDGPMSTS